MEMMKINTKEMPVFINKELAKATKRIVFIGTQIQKNLYEVAHILADVDARGLYKDDGFKSVVDYAGKTFGFKKSMAYSLLSVGKEYTDAEKLESNLPHEEGHDFSTTQIQRVLPIGDRQKVVEYVEAGAITPDMSCAEIQKFVKSLKAEGEGGGDGEGGDAVEEATEEIHQAAVEVLDELETLKQALFSAMGQLVDYMGAAEAGKIVTEYYNELAAKEVKENELVSE